MRSDGVWVNMDEKGEGGAVNSVYLSFIINEDICSKARISDKCNKAVPE